MNEFLAGLPLIIFVIFLIGYSIKALFVVYHLLKFGLDYKTKVLAVIFSSGLVLLISINYQLFSKVQWGRYIDISKYLMNF